MAPRPVPFTDEQRAAFQDEIVEWISEGKALRVYCRQEGKPSRQVVDLWRRQDDAFAGRFARAREIGYDEIADQALEIADTPEEGVIVTEDPEKGEIVRREDMLGHRKLRVETRLKLLARWTNRYSERPPEYLNRDLPRVASATDIPAAFAALFDAAREGRISVADLEAATRALDAARTAMGEAEFARELAELRARVEAKDPPAA